MFTTNIIIFLALAAVVTCHDIAIGTNTNGRKIFDETKQASTAIWRQINNVTVTANDGEVISRVVVKDMRPEKDGDVKIVEGGEGQKNVTIELKSPTALRGYDFQIEVYAIPDTNKGKDTSQKDVEMNMDGMINHPKDIGIDLDSTSASPVPNAVSKDDKRASRSAMNDDKKDQDPGFGVPFPINEFSTIEPENSSTETPLEDGLHNEFVKTSHDARDHEIVDFVLDMNDSAKEALMESQSATADLIPMELKRNSTEEKERVSRDASTTEESDIESTTQVMESTTIEAQKENKYGKIEPMGNQEFHYSRNWNVQNQDSLKVPIVATKNENSSQEKGENVKLQTAHL